MGFDPKSVQKNADLYDDVCISTIQGLLGTITSNLRTIGLGFYGKNVLYVVIFDKDPTDEELADIRGAFAKAAPLFLTHEAVSNYDEHYLTIPYPRDILVHIPNWGLIYERKEPPNDVAD